MCISGKPHSFLVSSLGLLLVFRTNSAYQRFAEGRKIWENILSVSRNISRLATLYEKDLGGERRHRILRLLGAFPYLLHRHIIPGTGCLDPKEYQQLKGTKFAMKLNEFVDRNEKVDYYSDLTSTLSSGNIVSYLYSTTKAKLKRIFRLRRRSRRFISGNDNGESPIYQVEASSKDPNDYDDEECDVCMVDKRSLAWCLLPPSALRKLTKEKLCPPLWCCDRMSAEICEIPFSTIFTSRERLAFLSQIDKLSKSIGECERIHQTAVPLNYARHSLRSLTIWLFSLPFALVADFGLLTAPVMGVISWLLFG
jgi:predicted membrane chloride channel (bestrophin family)